MSVIPVSALPGVSGPVGGRWGQLGSRLAATGDFGGRFGQLGNRGGQIPRYPLPAAAAVGIRAGLGPTHGRPQFSDGTQKHSVPQQATFRQQLLDIIALDSVRDVNQNQPLWQQATGAHVPSARPPEPLRVYVPEPDAPYPTPFVPTFIGRPPPARGARAGQPNPALLRGGALPLLGGVKRCKKFTRRRCTRSSGKDRNTLGRKYCKRYTKRRCKRRFETGRPLNRRPAAPAPPAGPAPPAPLLLDVDDDDDLPWPYVSMSGRQAPASARVPTIRESPRLYAPPLPAEGKRAPGSVLDPDYGARMYGPGGYWERKQREWARTPAGADDGLGAARQPVVDHRPFPPPQPAELSYRRLLLDMDRDSPWGHVPPARPEPVDVASPGPAVDVDVLVPHLPAHYEGPSPHVLYMDQSPTGPLVRAPAVHDPDSDVFMYNAPFDFRQPAVVAPPAPATPVPMDVAGVIQGSLPPPNPDLDALDVTMLDYLPSPKVEPKFEPKRSPKSEREHKYTPRSAVRPQPRQQPPRDADYDYAPDFELVGVSNPQIRDNQARLRAFEREAKARYLAALAAAAEGSPVGSPPPLEPATPRTPRIPWSLRAAAPTGSQLDREFPFAERRRELLAADLAAQLHKRGYPAPSVEQAIAALPRRGAKRGREQAELLLEPFRGPRGVRLDKVTGKRTGPAKYKRRTRYGRIPGALYDQPGTRANPLVQGVAFELGDRPPFHPGRRGTTRRTPYGAVVRVGDGLRRRRRR